MKKLIVVTLLLSVLSSYSQTVEITEATDEDLKEYLSVTYHAFKQDQENYYEKTRMWGFEFVIYYEDKPLYRGDILKPYFASPGMYHNQNSSKYSLGIRFLIPLDGLDRETQLQLREHDKLMLVEGDNEKKYVSPKPVYTIARSEEYKNEFTTHTNLTDKVSIKIFKTVLKN